MPLQKKNPIAVALSAGTSQPDPLLVPVSEAARLLGVSEYSVRLLARKSQLAFKKLSPTKWLITMASIRKFADAKVA
jgi:Helix-turn-helix domain